MLELEEVWRCARAMNLKPKSPSPPTTWWVSCNEIELLYNPFSNRTQLYDLITRFMIDVQWAKWKKVRARIHGEAWDLYFWPTLEKAVITRVAGKFKDLPYRT